MNTADEFVVDEIIQETAGATVYRARRSADGGRLALKVLRAAPPSPRHLEQLRREYELRRSTDSPGAVRVHELTTWRGRHALVLEGFGDTSLDRLVGAPMPLGRALRIALQVASALASIHARGIVHRDVKPANILVDTRSDTVKITDFGIASVMPSEPPAPRSPGLIQGSLAYMPPELTGRTNRAIDERADLYSLGIALYEMLTGRLPFQASDPIEWIHCHVARAPAMPTDALPKVLSDIVLKLLAKMPEDRYQSALGLKHDLERCLSELEAKGTIDPFPLAERDGAERFEIPQRLYGRDRELAALRGAFERVVTTGTPELVLISGYSGIGKTSLAGELGRPIVRERGFYEAGKFDQHKRDIPYATIAQAFQDLMAEILAEADERIAVWRARLGGALGPNGRLVTELVPRVELILGKQPPVPELPPADAQYRFQTVFRQFIGVFAQKIHPLVLFLDDLQWADTASLALLQHVLAHPDTRHLLVVGAYRDNEVSPLHPLMSAVDHLRRSGVRICDIVLGPLSSEHIAEQIADAVHRSIEEVRSLSVLVHEKTLGNPFFVRQFLGELYRDRQIVFDSSARVFRWNVAKIAEKGYTDNIVDLMAEKIKRQSHETQEAMMLAACVGNTCDIPTLAVICGCSEDELEHSLLAALKEGLLLRLDGAYKFLHDRVQQAAYALIPDGDRASVHLRIGRLLQLAHASPEDTEAHVFDIVGHMNLGSRLITDTSEAARLADLNLAAGRRAKASTAYVSAATYFAAGMELLPGDCWATQYATTYALQRERADCAFLSGDFETAERLIDVLLRHAQGRGDLAEVHRIEIDISTTVGEYERAYLRARSCAHLFGIELPPHPTHEEVDRAVRNVWDDLSTRRIETIIKLPRAVSPEMKAAMAALRAALAAAYFTDVNRRSLMTCHLVRLSLSHGNTDASPVAYAWFGVLLRRFLGLYQEGYRLGNAAYALTEEADLAGGRAVCWLVLAIMVNHWIEPYRDVLRLFRLALQAAIETGDLPVACYSSVQLVGYAFAAGDRLDDVADEAEKQLGFMRRAKYNDMHDIVVYMYRAVQSLRGTVPETSVLEARGPTDGPIDALLSTSAPPITLFYLNLCAVQRGVTFGDYESAALAALSAKELVAAAEDQMQVTEHCYYSALALSGHYPSVPPERQREYLAILKAYESELRAWAEVGPASKRSRHATVAAELARLTGAELTAMHLYERAIRWAREDGFVQCEAIAWELAARFHRECGLATSADAYLREACASYARWGADGKVQKLRRLHPHLAEERPLAPTSTFAVRPEQLDLLSVLKASQSISREIVLPELCETLMRIVLEQAGAQSGALLLARDGQLEVHAEAVVDAGQIRVLRLKGAPMSTVSLPSSILQYVVRTHEPLILDDAATSARFSPDDYILQSRPRSLLCLPIIRQARVSGLLYLENNLTTGAFSVNKINVLEVLAAQVAISLDNATLYDDLRRSRSELEAVLDNMVDGVLVVDRSGRIVLTNRAAMKLLGLRSSGEEHGSFEEVARRVRFRSSGRGCNDPERMPLSRALLGETLALAEGTLTRPGTERPLHLHVSAAPMRDEQGAVVSAVTVWRDVTEAVELDLLKDQFLRVAAHELKTPVTVIKGYAEALLHVARELPEHQRRMLDALVRGSGRIDRIVADLLFLSQIQLDRLDLALERVDLGELVNQVAVRMMKASPQHRVRIEGSRPVTVEGDRQLLEQVLMHLIDNAMRYSPGGSEIDVSLDVVQERELIVSIRDHGVGIPREKQGRIFECFYRAHTDTPYDFGGMGTGLYICRAIVRRHKGRTWFKSEEGRGSTFCFCLPLASTFIHASGVNPHAADRRVGVPADA
jgi:predicted ATPase/signal transduction histidine kinase